MGLILRLGVVWVMAGVIMALSGCGSVEIYGGLRRSDSRVITETTSAPQRGLMEKVGDWLFVNHEKEA